MNRLTAQAIPLVVAPTALEYNAVRHPIGKAIAQGKVRISRCGIGAKKAASFCQNLDPALITRIILIGWAGGLIDGLQAGQVVSADLAIMHGKPDLLIDVLPVMDSIIHTGSMLTVLQALATPSEKLAARETGADAVEMEAYPIATWAKTHDIPFNHLRVILDTWDETLLDFNSSPTSEQTPSIFQFLGHIPKTINDLTWLYRRIHSVNPVLGQITTMALDAIHNSPI